MCDYLNSADYKGWLQMVGFQIGIKGLRTDTKKNITLIGIIQQKMESVKINKDLEGTIVKHFGNSEHIKEIHKGVFVWIPEGYLSSQVIQDGPIQPYLFCKSGIYKYFLADRWYSTDIEADLPPIILSLWLGQYPMDYIDE